VRESTSSRGGPTPRPLCSGAPCPLNRDSGQTIRIAEAIALAAYIAADHGDLVASATLTYAARPQLHALGMRGTRPANICLEKAEAIIADTPRDLSGAHARGERMTVEEKVDEAMEVLDRCTSQR
jgi:hypothetical protein